jgi:hypothetical protein
VKAARWMIPTMMTMMTMMTMIMWRYCLKLYYIYSSSIPFFLCLDDPELVVADGAGDWDRAIIEVRGVGKRDESEPVPVRL